MELVTLPNAWKREFLRPNGAMQVAQAYIDGDGTRRVEIELRLLTQHHVMTLGWQERARKAAERKLNADPEGNGRVIFLDLSELDDV